MKYFLPILIAIPLIFVSSVSAANLEISKSSSFSSEDKNFSQGEKIYVRINSDSTGDKTKVLNLRDNNYSVLSSYGLSKNGNTFSASLNAPNSSGYYSLEARVESDGKSTVGVRTIKVGDATSANIKVEVKQNTTGSNTTVQKSETKEEVKVEKNKEDMEEEQKEEVEESPAEEVFGSDQVEESQSGFFTAAWAIVKNFWQVIWIFA